MAGCRRCPTARYRVELGFATSQRPSIAGQVDDVVLDRDLLAVGELGDHGGDHRRRLRGDLDDAELGQLRRLPDREAARIAEADRGRERTRAVATRLRQLEPPRAPPRPSSAQAPFPSRASSAVMNRRTVRSAPRSSSVCRGSSDAALGRARGLLARRRPGRSRPRGRGGRCPRGRGQRWDRLVVAAPRRRHGAVRGIVAASELIGRVCIRPCILRICAAPLDVRASGLGCSGCRSIARDDANLDRVTHLRPVPDPAPPRPRGRRREGVGRRARALGDDAAHRLRQHARGREVGASRLLAFGRRHRRRALFSRPPPRSRQPRMARARPIRALQGPRGADPVCGSRATPATSRART